jgi:hypothetical protein
LDKDYTKYQYRKYPMQRQEQTDETQASSKFHTQWAEILASEGFGRNLQ